MSVVPTSSKWKQVWRYRDHPPSLFPASIYDTEGLGILHALGIAPPNAHITIRCDNKAIVNAANDALALPPHPKNSASAILSAISIAASHLSSPPTIRIRAHQSQISPMAVANNRADALAKSATESDGPRLWEPYLMFLLSVAQG